MKMLKKGENSCSEWVEIKTVFKKEKSFISFLIKSKNVEYFQLQ